MENRHHPERKLGHLLSIPFIYWIAVPAVFWDLSLELYHRICFPLYGLPLIERRRYIKIDRHRLAYLSGLERINCAYCGYVNGLLAYSVQIVAETERYWCAIQHAKDPNFRPPAHHTDFTKYADQQALEARYPAQKHTRS
ncbi:hypothetical protein HY375_02505 [Candidatus Berkelbacteria bacterium]|nr:hypothetical protein [Candidatus Berkelbacteria bacterium]